MLKKALFVGGALVLLLGLAFGRDACSYISTTVDRVQASVKSHIPPEVEIERARQGGTRRVADFHDRPVEGEWRLHPHRPGLPRHER